MGIAGQDLKLYEVAEACFQRSVDVSLHFFEKEAEQISQACLAMAQRFYQNGRLLAFGAGNSMTDAQHVSVEFVHPVVVGKRALPAIALGTDLAATMGLSTSKGWDQVYAQQLTAVGRAEDIALGIDPSGQDGAVQQGLAVARQMGMLAISLCGGAGGQLVGQSLEFCFVVPVKEAAVIQETHETLYHILWELVHVFFDHKGLLEQDET